MGYKKVNFMSFMYIYVYVLGSRMANYSQFSQLAVNDGL